MEEIMMRLKGLGIDCEKAEGVFEDRKAYVDAVRGFFVSQDFMRLGQSINHAQWQAAAMKAGKMSARAKELGVVGIEKQMTGIRMNINAKKKEEALGLLSLIIQKRVKTVEFFQELKREEK